MGLPLRGAGLALLLSLSAAPSWGAPGTTSPDFLRLGVAPRPTAMGEAYTALADDVHAMAYNPAGLALLRRQEVAFMHHQYLQGISQEYAAYAYPTNRFGTVAFAANLLSVSPFSSFDENDQPAGTVSAQDLALSGAYAVSWRKLSIGVHGKYVSSRLADVTARGSAYDAGALLQMAYGFQAGAAVQNVGKGLRYDRESAPLPRMTRGGLGWKGRFLWPGSSAAVGVDGVFARDRDPFVAGGAEVALIPSIALRVGYRGSQEDDLKFSWGAGFKIPMGRSRSSNDAGGWWRPPDHPDYDSTPTELELDYAFVRLGDLGLTHRVSILLRFGNPRERENSPSWRRGYVPTWYD